jgi:hypothetical protein
MSRFFLSYNSADKKLVQEVAARLEAEGASVWRDERAVDFGDDFVAAIDRGIANCEYVLPFISVHSIARPWIEYEIERALALQEQARCSVIPVFLDDVAIPEKLAHITGIDLRQNIQDGLSKLLQLVTAVITRVVPIGEEHELIWTRRKFNGLTKTTGSSIFASVSTTGERPPALVAVLFKIFGDLPGATIARDALQEYLPEIWKRANEGQWRLSFSHEDIVQWLTLTDAVLLFVKKQHPEKMRTVGAAVGVMQALGDLCAIAYVGDIGAFVSYATGKPNERAYDVAVNTAPPEYRMQHPSLPHWELLRAPIGNLYTPDWGETNRKSTVPKIINLAADGAYAALFSHEVPKTDVKRFLQHVGDDASLTLTAERICTWQRPSVTESACVIYRRTKPAAAVATQSE